MPKLSKALGFQKALFESEGAKFGQVKDLSTNGHCSGCGGCCSDIFPITQREVDTLRHFVRTHNYKPNTRITAVMTATYDMTCPFLNKEDKCDVYAIRPATCQLFKCWVLSPMNPEDLDKLPEETKRGYLALLAQNPEAVSLRQTIFNQKVPF